MNNNQCPIHAVPTTSCMNCVAYDPSTQPYLGVIGGVPVEKHLPQSREQTKATIGDSTQNQPTNCQLCGSEDAWRGICHDCWDAHQTEPQESTTAAKGHAPHCQSLLVVDVPCTCEPKEAKPAICECGHSYRQHNPAPVLYCRQPCLCNKFSEATAVSHDKIVGYTCEEPSCSTIHPLDTPSKSTDKEYNHYLGIDYALQNDPAFRREYIRTHEAPTSSDGQGVSEDTMPLGEILAFNLSDCDMELHPNAYLFINQTTPKLQAYLSSEKVKELKALLGNTISSKRYDLKATPHRIIEQRIKELEDGA